MTATDSNLYQTGDYVYVETSSTTPYQIRRIEDFKLGPDGNVEAKVTCVYRRTNLPPSLISLADTLHAAEAGTAGEPSSSDGARLWHHLARQRELFPSRQTETVPAGRIRGRCSVGLLSGAEQPRHYLDKENTFYYWLLYDPSQRSLVADRGEIRIGPEFQAPPPPDRCTLRPGETDPEPPRPPDTLLWTPGRIDDAEVDTFLRLARSVGTLARALEPVDPRCGASLHLAASAAGRDTTTQHAMDALHAADYRLPAALTSLVGRRGGTDKLALCRDQLDAWTPAEAQLFERAIGKCGKSFGDIRRDFLPWKSSAQLVEYYYLWKTADRYLRRRLTKAAAAAGRPTRLLLPDCPRWDGAESAPQPVDDRRTNGAPACAGCSASRAARWFAWGWRRLCGVCWLHWRRYGGLRRPPANDVPSLPSERRPLPRAPVSRTGRGRRTPAAPRRGSHLPTFQMRPPPLLLLARRLCAGRLRLRRLARGPLRAISGPDIQTQCLQLLSELSEPELEQQLAARSNGARLRRRQRRPDLLLQRSTGQTTPDAPAWLTDGEPVPVTTSTMIEAFPRPPTAPDGSFVYTPVRNRRPGVGLLRGLSLGSASSVTLPGSPALRVRRPSISQTPLRRSSTSC